MARKPAGRNLPEKANSATSKIAAASDKRGRRSVPPRDPRDRRIRSGRTRGIAGPRNKFKIPTTTASRSKNWARLMPRSSTKGADPYEAGGSTSVESTELQPSPMNHIATRQPAGGRTAGSHRSDDETAAEVTPLTILEAMLFVGHPLGEPLTSQQIAGLMRGVRPAEIDELVQELNEGTTATARSIESRSMGRLSAGTARPNGGRSATASMAA